MSEKQMKRSAAELKRMMFLSLISLILTVIVIIGATFAWFNYATKNDENIIKTTGMDFEIYSYDNSVRGDEPLSLSEFDIGAFIDRSGEPFMKGDFGTKYFEVVNTGSQPIAVKIQIKFDEDSKDMAGAIKFCATTDINAEPEWSKIIALGGYGGNIIPLHNNEFFVIDSQVIRIDYRMDSDLTSADAETSPLKAEIWVTASQHNTYDSAKKTYYYVKDLDDLEKRLAKENKEGATLIFTQDINIDDSDSIGPTVILVPYSYNINLNGFKLNSDNILEFEIGSECYMLGIENGEIECEELHFTPEEKTVAIKLSSDLNVIERAVPTTDTTEPMIPATSAIGTTAPPTIIETIAPTTNITEPTIPW